MPEISNPARPAGAAQPRFSELSFPGKQAPDQDVINVHRLAALAESDPSAVSEIGKIFRGESAASLKAQHAAGDALVKLKAVDELIDSLDNKGTTAARLLGAIGPEARDAIPHLERLREEASERIYDDIDAAFPNRSDHGFGEYQNAIDRIRGETRG